MKPLSDKMFVLPEHEPVSKFILTSDKDKKKTPIGVILEVGEAIKQFKPRQKVLFNKYNAATIKLVDDTEVYVLSEEDIYATVED